MANEDLKEKVMDALMNSTLRSILKWGVIALIGTIYLRGCVLDGIERRLSDLNTSVQSLKPQLKKADVLAGKGEEEFYEIDGKKAFVKIDGYSIKNLYNKGEKDISLDYLQNFLKDAVKK
jgi:hypothetical protein